jgi:H+/Cl- antiporter ClcA
VTGLQPDRAEAAIGDFTTTRRVIPLSLLAVAIGLLATGAAWALLALIGLFTNLFFYHRFSTALVAPAGSPLGLWMGVVPVLGSLIIGLLARYGSERIRGHGIPEAIEAILTKGSRIQPKLAVLKPLSAAISIGSGGPFGAEGPIIMTGGAFGSMIAQAFHLSSAERKTLLVAGAAAGMSATFASPIAAVLLAFELLLFEWKPRSFVPVALASATAAVARRPILGLGPLFPALHVGAVGPKVLIGCLVVGLSAGAVSAAMTLSVYAAEDRFKRLRLHWMWWPAIGGLAVGVGGIACPRALGVGYEQIGQLLGGQMVMRDILILVAVKWTIWAVSLGSGTSGGVLAPLLMIGSALGGIEAGLLPTQGPGFWPLVSMGAILGGTMRSPLTGIFFACELTGDFGMILPVMVATTCAHLFTVLAMKRSILTEKVARRGLHISREYGIDPLETLFVSDVIAVGPADASLPTAFADETLSTVVYRMAAVGVTRMRVIERDDPGRAKGEISLTDLLKARLRRLEEERRREGALPLNPTRHLHEASRRALSLLRRPLDRRSR